jgi:OOP family OmpA-OmpF porin
MSGKTVIFIISDGQYTTGVTVGSGGYDQPTAGDPVEAAAKIASKYDVCYYIMSTATKAKDRETLRRMAAVNTCSRVVPLEVAAATEPCTAAVLCTIKATERVVTYTKVVGMDVDTVYYGFDRSDIQAQYRDDLDALGRFLQANPNAYAILRGYTDSTGDEDYNMGLSRRRAEGLNEYLLKNFSIGSERVITQWYGEANPADSNATSEGRAKNRRVEIDVAGLV